MQKDTLCLIGVIGIILALAFATLAWSEKQVAKALPEGVTSEEAVIFAVGYEQGYRKCLMDAMEVAIEHEGSSNEIMDFLIKASQDKVTKYKLINGK